MSAEYDRGLRAAAELADFYAVELFRLAGDTIHLDPVLTGRNVSQAAMAQSDDLRTQGHGYASGAHAAQDIATAIRAKLGSQHGGDAP